MYAGGPVQPAGWDAPIVVDLAGLETSDEQYPVLKDHDPDKVVGHGAAVNTGTKVLLKGVVSGTGDAAQEVLDTAANGFQWRSSIGCDRVGPTRFVPEGQSIQANGQTFRGPLYFWPSFHPSRSDHYRDEEQTRIPALRLPLMALCLSSGVHVGTSPAITVPF